MAPVWYRVKSLDDARAFYTGTLGFEETYVDDEGRWARLRHGSMEIALAEGEPEESGGVAHVDVADVKADINRDTLWPSVTEYGLRPNGQVAVDEVWSALRFRPYKEGEAPFTGGR